ncbi:Endonuclease/Exonuclease/phosphatase family protein [Paraliobacillus sp. PM-2]|uniref:endonuclease/exonuclease/phosphatase family protein n=1 Tax=Paraliobacillus sp. PM-2 TaxID=1462524 RepID=UPI00061BC925|nr:endonuclease/exonuclease/phosphatase family protein [Paraliobacillus sp. PM-2]CQR47377.1 Endonuclease/Exonuclease/phosphatase family protein [Paraliobacillus sp. PM-2]
MNRGVEIVSNTIIAKKIKKPKKVKTSFEVTTSNILFWNLMKKDLSTVIKDLVEKRSFDILFFSETTQKSRDALNQALEPLGFSSRTQLKGNVRVALFDKYKDSEVLFFKEDQRFTIIIYNFSGDKYMLVGVHLDSPVSFPDESDRYVISRDEYSLIASYINSYTVKKVLIIGDFNMNPFDRGMVSELSFKATHCKQTAKTVSKGKDYFFNPSWSIFSNDLTGKLRKPPGTIHYVPRNKDTYVDYWHAFDQVLISPYISSTGTNSFEVLTGWSKVDLLDTNLIPNRINYSDHLPISYTLEIKK